MFMLFCIKKENKKPFQNERVNPIVLKGQSAVRNGRRIKLTMVLLCACFV
jgi:hypothetical protein